MLIQACCIFISFPEQKKEGTCIAGQISDHMDRTKHLIASHFGLKVARYHDHALVQRQLLDHLLPFYRKLWLKGAIWADIGCGDGSFEMMHDNTSVLPPRIGIDISLQSVKFCTDTTRNTTNWICADMEIPPLTPASLDGIIAASVLQWASAFPDVIMTFSSLLRPGGIMLFSLFTDGSFTELHRVRRHFGMPVPIRLPSVNETTSLFSQSGLTETEIHPFSQTLYFTSAFDVLRHFSAIGSTASFTSSLTRRQLQDLCSYYETHFGTAKGIPITYKAHFGFTRKGGTHE
jgi:malonyl-CoA O-methyltransferase